MWGEKHSWPRTDWEPNRGNTTGNTGSRDRATSRTGRRTLPFPAHRTTDNGHLSCNPSGPERRPGRAADIPLEHRDEFSRAAAPASLQLEGHQQAVHYRHDNRRHLTARCLSCLLCGSSFYGILCAGCGSVRFAPGRDHPYHPRLLYQMSRREAAQMERVIGSRCSCSSGARNVQKAPPAKGCAHSIKRFRS